MYKFVDNVKTVLCTKTCSDAECVILNNFDTVSETYNILSEDRYATGKIVSSCNLYDYLKDNPSYTVGTLDVLNDKTMKEQLKVNDEYDTVAEFQCTDDLIVAYIKIFGKKKDKNDHNLYLVTFTLQGAGETRYYAVIEAINSAQAVNKILKDYLIEETRKHYYDAEKAPVFNLNKLISIENIGYNSSPDQKIVYINI